MQVISQARKHADAYLKKQTYLTPDKTTIEVTTRLVVLYAGQAWSACPDFHLFDYYLLAFDFFVVAGFLKKKLSLTRSVHPLNNTTVVLT